MSDTYIEGHAGSERGERRGEAESNSGMLWVRGGYARVLRYAESEKESAQVC